MRSLYYVGKSLNCILFTGLVTEGHEHSNKHSIWDHSPNSVCGHVHKALSKVMPWQTPVGVPNRR